MSADDTGSYDPRRSVFPGLALGKYRIVEEIGIGGMAQVFLAVLDGPDGFTKPVVIKRILPEYADDDSFLQMFVNEAKVASMMSHPNIVQVHEFSRSEDDHYFLAMEYVNGASLDRVVRAARKVNYPLGPRFAVELGIPVAQALSYAHGLRMPDGTPLNLVHRDVSPGNVLISRDGVVKLSDFGVVKSAIAPAGTAAGVVKGKWSYMSPEQVSNKPIDHRSDLFSLGILIYEVATGIRLFRGESLATTVGAVMTGEIQPPSKVRPDIPPEFDVVVMKALARLPGQRYRSAAELGDALEAFRGSQGWSTAGSKVLSNTINALFPRDPLKSIPPRVPPPVAVSRPSAPPPNLPPEPPTDPTNSLRVPAPGSVVASVPGQGEAPISAVMLAALVAAVVLVSTLFWFLVL